MERTQDHSNKKRRLSSPRPDAAGPSSPALQGISNQAMQRGRSGLGRAQVWEGGSADRMLHSVGALGAALGPDVLVSRNLDWKTRKAVLAHELTHVRQTGGRAPSGPIRSIGAPGSREERQARVAGAIGVPLGGRAAAADPGVLRLFDPNELLYGSVTEAWVQALDDDELVEAGAGLRDEMERLVPDSAEYAGALANNAIIERELLNRGLDFERHERAAETVARRPGGPPVTFALDSETGETYVSVTGGGATMADVATYLYGSPELAIELGEHNGIGAESSIMPGTTLRLLVGRHSDAAERALEAGHETGAMIVTKGVPASLADQGDVYIFRGPAGQLALNATQANLLLTGLRDRTIALLDIHLRALRDTLKIRNSHEDDSWAMRNVIEWYGEVELPEREAFDSSISSGESTLADLQALVFEPDPRDTAKALCALQKQGGEVAGASGRLSDEMSGYFHGFLSGGATLVNQLEFARNVSFGIVAGLAGAVVAPAAFAYFAATYGTVAATGLAIGTAGTTGGLLRGGMEVALPGAQGDRPVEERFRSGFWSGFVAGGTGAAGAFVTPAVSGAVTTSLVNRYGTAFVQSRVGQYAVQGSTGAIVGAPSGVVGTGIETLPALARGEMSGEDYVWGMGTSGALGFGLGGGFGAASTRFPVAGLYRDRSGAPVMPSWMLAGPASPLGNIRGVHQGFHAMPEEALPPLGYDNGLEGYSWVRLRGSRGDEWAPIRSYGPRQEFELAWYAEPNDAAAGANFNLLYGPRDNVHALKMIGSRGTQRPAPTASGYRGMAEDDPYPGAPSSTREDFAYELGDLDVLVPGGPNKVMIRGHNVDHRDTVNRTATLPDSNIDPRNITPEPREWGTLMGRHRLTERMRRANPGGGTQYRQVNVYGPNPEITVVGKPVPRQIYFIEVGPDGLPVRAWRVPFDDPDAFAGLNMHRAADIDAGFGIDPATLPGVEVVDPTLLPPAIVAAAWSGPEEEEAQPLLP